LEVFQSKWRSNGELVARVVSVSCEVVSKHLSLYRRRFQINGKVYSACLHSRAPSPRVGLNVQAGTIIRWHLDWHIHWLGIIIVDHYKSAYCLLVYNVSLITY